MNEPNIRRLIRRMGSRTQLLEWMAYWEAEPRGERRRDYQSAQVCAIFANFLRNKRQFPKPFPTSAFLLEFGEGEAGSIPAPVETKPARRDWRELKAIAQSLAEMYNAEHEAETKKRQRLRPKSNG